MESEVAELVLKTKENGNSYLYMECTGNQISLKGDFSDLDALNFMAALAIERPDVYKQFKNWKPQK